MISNTQQYTTYEENALLLLPKGTTYIKYLVGSLLYFVRSIEMTILPVLNDISTSQAKPTKQTKEKYNK